LAPPSSSDSTEASEPSDPWKNVTYGQLIQYVLHRYQSIGIGFLNQKQIIETQALQTSPALQAQTHRQVIVFSLGKKWQTQKRDPEATRQTLEDGYWAAVKLNRDISGLKKERTVESCVARAWQFGLSDDTLARAQGLIDAAQDLKKEELERSSFEIANDSIHHYERAVVVPIESIEEASTYLLTLPQDDHALDLLFILHGSNDGLLLDASGSIVPRSFFRSLGQRSFNISSIAIFSCYSTQVANFYGSVFEQLHASGIQLLFPVDKIHFGEQNTVPLNALDVFIEKHALTLGTLPTRE
jgi:hypothetical protein